MKFALVLALANLVFSQHFSRFYAAQKHLRPEYGSLRSSSLQNHLGLLPPALSFHPYLPEHPSFHPYLPDHASFHPYLPAHSIKRSPHAFRFGHALFDSAQLVQSGQQARQEHGPKGKRGAQQKFRTSKRSSFDEAKEISECMTVDTMTSEEDTWFYRSNGHSEACGLYIVGDPSTRLEITVEYLDVDCSNGLVMLFDGWELNGNVFPSVEDHPLPLKERSSPQCSQDNKIQRVFQTSQNAGLISYNVPTPGQGFKVKVRAMENTDVCNILMSELAGFFTLQNNGKARNCTLTTLLFPANFNLLSLDVGEPQRAKRSQVARVQTQCSELGLGDYIELGGSAELNSNLLTSQTICGFKPKPIEKGLTVLCGSSTVRLVSSGSFDNTVTVFIKAADEEDLDFDNNMIMSCPDE